MRVSESNVVLFGSAGGEDNLLMMSKNESVQAKQKKRYSPKQIDKQRF
jgi:hypothetical protein